MTWRPRAFALLALPACALLGCGQSDARHEPELPPVAAAVDGHLDPAPYREQIEATETLLYSPEPLDDDGWKQLSRALLELHNSIVFRDTSAPARETSRRLFFFSAQVDAESAPKHNADGLAVMRGVWEKIRSDQFTPADWFRTASR
jgi:hypothetical protein